MNETYDWTSFTIYMYYRAPLEKVYTAWATPAGLESFFIKTAQLISSSDLPKKGDVLAQAGDQYQWEWHHDYRLEGSYLASEMNRLLTFTFGKMKVTVEFTDLSGQVMTKLTQSNIPTDNELDIAWSHMNCRSCWIYFMLNLKSVLEQSMDLREHEPDKSDCVGIGFKPLL